MSTGNRGQLFPDVTEHYGPQPTPTEDSDTGSVHLPIPDPPVSDDDAVIQTDLEPIDVTESTVETDPAPVDPVDHPAPGPDGDGDAATEVDPYADAPDWVRAHIPRGPLVIAQRSRGGLKSAIGRSRAPRRTPAAPELVEQTAAAPATDTAAVAPAKPGGDRSRTWMFVGGGIAALAAMSAVVVNVMSTGTDEPEAPLPPVTAVASSSATSGTARPSQS